MTRLDVINNFIDYAVSTEQTPIFDIAQYREEIKDYVTNLTTESIHLLRLYSQEAIYNKKFDSVVDALYDIENNHVLNIHSAFLVEDGYEPYLYLGFRKYLTIQGGSLIVKREHKLKKENKTFSKSELNLIDFGVRASLAVRTAFNDVSFRNMLSLEPKTLEDFLKYGFKPDKKLTLKALGNLVMRAKPIDNMCDVINNDSLKLQFIKETEELYFAIKTDNWYTYCINLSGYNLTEDVKSLKFTIRCLLYYFLYIRNMYSDIVLEFDKNLNIITAQDLFI